MPPDADQPRQRHFQKEDEGEETVEHESNLKNLKGNEICIDGVIYDLEGFAHPGGDQIMLFGGNDVTVQYKMIHPHHSGKQLEKMRRVGTIPDYKCEYAFGTPFEMELKREVFKIVRRGREYGTPGYFARVAFYTALYFSLMYSWVVNGPTWSLAVVFGVSQALMGLNVQHDANHGAASKTSWINDVLGLFADMIGYSKWLWIEQHWTHHTYTNHNDKDPDSTAGEPAMIFYNYPADSANRTWMHRFQAVFFLPLFCFYWASTVFNFQQVLMLDHEGTKGAGMSFKSDYVTSRRKFAVMLRILYIYIHIVTAFQHRGFTWGAVGQVFLMGVAGSLALAIPFSLSHNFVGAEREPTMDYQTKNQQVCWFKAQVETSCTYGGFVAGCFTGGLNFQIEHHLFPRMCSAWYPYIAPTVREVCAKHGVIYTYYPTIWHNLISTIKYMHAVGNGKSE